MTDNETAGTPKLDGGDAAATPTTGTPAEDGRNAQSGEAIEGGTITKAEALQWKAKAEQTNAYEQRVRELEQRIAAQQTPAPQPAGESVADRQNRMEALRAQARQFAAGDPSKGIAPDPVAAYLLEKDAQDEEDKRNTLLGFQLFAVPEAIRQEVLDTYNRGGLRDINDAHERVKSQKTGTELQQLRAENERLKAQQAASQNKPTVNVVPGASAREGPTTPTDVTTMTKADAMALIEQERAAKGDFAAMAVQERIGKDIKIV